jgi:hypothetical protein
MQLRVRDLFAKWMQRKKRQFDDLKTEGYPNDRYAEDDSAEKILEKQEKPSPDNDPQYVSNQTHRFLLRTCLYNVGISCGRARRPGGPARRVLRRRRDGSGRQLHAELGRFSPPSIAIDRGI